MPFPVLELLTSRLKGCPRHHKGQPNKPHKAEVKAVFEDLLGRPQDHAGNTHLIAKSMHTEGVWRTLLEQGQAAVGLRQTFGKWLANGYA